MFFLTFVTFLTSHNSLKSSNADALDGIKEKVLNKLRNLFNAQEKL